MNTVSKGIKRFCDISVSVTGLAVTGLPILGIAFTMAAVNKSKPFFVQTRVGKDGKPFDIYKITTLRDYFDKAGRALSDEERITVLGAFLRKTRINELPQLMNVIKGEMSIVGPRPNIPEQFISQNEERQSVLPGLLGDSQIRLGHLGNMDEKLRVDIDYARNQSL